MATDASSGSKHKLKARDQNLTLSVNKISSSPNLQKVQNDFDTLFVYGSLLDEDVRKALFTEKLEKQLKKTPCTLVPYLVSQIKRGEGKNVEDARDVQLFRVKDEPFPALYWADFAEKRTPGRPIFGLMLENIDADTAKLLRWFEEEYTIVECEVEIEDEQATGAAVEPPASAAFGLPPGFEVSDSSGSPNDNELPAAPAGGDLIRRATTLCRTTRVSTYACLFKDEDADKHGGLEAFLQRKGNWVFERDFLPFKEKYLENTQKAREEYLQLEQK